MQDTTWVAGTLGYRSGLLDNIARGGRSTTSWSWCAGPPLAALAKAGWVAQGAGGDAIFDPGGIRGSAVTSGELQVEDATKTSAHLVQERQRGVARVVGEVGLVQGDEGGHVDDRIPG